MRGATLPLPHTSLWHGVSLSRVMSFLTFFILIIIILIINLIAFNYEMRSLNKA
jgi:hypothetical protein